MYQFVIYVVFFELDFGQVFVGIIQKYWLFMIIDGVGVLVCFLVLIVCGKKEGLVLGLIVVIYGNEFNGILVIQCLFVVFDVSELFGMVIGVFVMNILGFMLEQCKFNDGVDFNCIVFGDFDGNLSQVYIYCFIEWVLWYFDYLIDLYIVSVGCINLWYICVDMSQFEMAWMAML